MSTRQCQILKSQFCSSFIILIVAGWIFWEFLPDVNPSCLPVRRRTATHLAIFSQKSTRCYRVARCIGCLIFINDFPQKSGSFAERDLQFKASCASSPPCSSNACNAVWTLAICEWVCVFMWERDNVCVHQKAREKVWVQECERERVWVHVCTWRVYT